MKNIIIIILLMVCLLPVQAYAVYDPTKSINNKVGVHILFPTEIDEAAALVNSNGGEWGYVTIPIQSGDKNLQKWQTFLNKARDLHVIPLIRLATEGDYFNTKVWRKPAENDILDFANFLNSLTWPTKNRYIIVFNEVNRSDEWGSDANPREYAQMLSYSVTVFKSKSEDFFILSAGFDNASADIKGQSYNEYTFMKAMNTAIPGIFNQIDGLASHSYPNPGFSQPPSKQNQESIVSYKFEKKLAEQLSNKILPVFITETGWPTNVLSESQVATYYKEAFTNMWIQDELIAITPFLLRAHSGPFTFFSLLSASGQPSLSYKEIQSLTKTKGNPVLSPQVLSVYTNRENNQPIKSFSHTTRSQALFSIPPHMKAVMKWFLKL